MSSESEDSLASGEEENMSEEPSSGDESDDAPESVSFGKSKVDALETISLALKETKRLKEETKEKRRNRHDLLKKQKQKKIDLSSAKLPDSILEEISQLDEAKEKKSTDTSSATRPRTDSGSSSDEDEGISEGEEEDSEEDDAADDADFLPLEGFKAVPLSQMRQKGPPAKETALEFLEKHLYGGRVHRESVNKHISRLHKREHKPALHFTKPGSNKKQEKGRRRRKKGKNWQSLLPE